MIDLDDTQKICISEIQLMLAEHGLEQMERDNQRACKAEAIMREIYFDDMLDKKIKDIGETINATQF